MSTLLMGGLATLSDRERSLLLDRRRVVDPMVRDRVASILARVKGEGDGALFALAEELDGVRLATLEVPRARWGQALDALEPGLRRAMTRAARNIASVHRAQLPLPIEVEPEPGVVVGRRPDPLERVGLYAPGGRARYPSSVLMSAIPARLAGVREIVLCSPPEASGEPSGPVLAAGALARVDRVFAIGGAGAIGAMAYGTASVPRADRVVGPGNTYVAEAKLQVSGEVSIDSPAGPSELLVIADAGADPRAVARELSAQAEHDPAAMVIALGCGEGVAARIAQALEATAVEAFAGRGAVLEATLDQALDFAAAFAPEHLLLAVTDPETLLPRVRNAGAVFLGISSSVVFGDYLTGSNHTLPTGGAARSYSGLSVLDFIRWTATQRVTPEAERRLAADTAVFATAEGLPEHAAAASARSDADA